MQATRAEHVGELRDGSNADNVLPLQAERQ